ncbi:21745_t:CDS:2, partial [Gigaspora margarita]
NMTTSRAEGAHAMLKAYLQVSVDDSDTPGSKQPILCAGHFKVSTFALKKVHEQFIKASNATPENPLWPCSGTFRSSMGLPCSHTIRELLDNDKCLQLDDFHQHWWIQQCQLPQQEPPITKDSLYQR